MSSPTKTIAFFGATGGCANKALVMALNAGYYCTALARTPQKLHDMLVANGVPATTVEKYLRIVKGDAKDEKAVRTTIAPPAALGTTAGEEDATTYEFDPQHTASTIITGIGMDPFAKNPDTTICQVFTATLRKALDSFTPPAGAPFLVVISTTGITAGPRDVPLLFVPLYYILLHTPHKDKRVMEELVDHAAADGKIRGACIVRPSLLMDWAELAPEKIRVGDENQPAVGYFISRLNVGRWVFDQCIAGDQQQWNNTKVSLTN